MRTGGFDSGPEDPGAEPGLRICETGMKLAMEGIRKEKAGRVHGAGQLRWKGAERLRQGSAGIEEKLKTTTAQRDQRR